jgi:predicted esterase YcpF (UPF0227 family)
MSSSDLSLARQLLKASAKSAGRKIEHQFRDLRHAVQHVIAHLEKAESYRDCPEAEVRG